MLSFGKKRKHKLPKKGNIETGKVIDNRARIIFKNTCELCYTTSFKPQQSRDIMFSSIDEDCIKHSNLVIVINIFGNNINSILEFLANKGTLKTEITKDDDEYIIIIGGSVIEYKDLIRNIPDLNNNVIQLIFECLYQLDYHLFNDFIVDGIMNRDLFVFETESEYTNTIDNYPGIIHIDPILDLYNSISGKIPLRRLCKFINVTLFHTSMSLYDLLGTNASYKITNNFSVKRDDKVNWAGNEWTLNSLGNLLVSVKDNINTDPNTAQLYTPIGTTVNSYTTISLDNLIMYKSSYEKKSNEYVEMYKYIEKYIIDNFGESFNIDKLSHPDYIQKTICDDETEYIDEVVSEEIMSADEYFSLLMEQENDEIKN